MLEKPSYFCEVKSETGVHKGSFPESPTRHLVGNVFNAIRVNFILRVPYQACLRTNPGGTGASHETHSQFLMRHLLGELLNTFGIDLPREQPRFYEAELDLRVYSEARTLKVPNQGTVCRCRDDPVRQPHRVFLKDQLMTSTSPNSSAFFPSIIHFSSVISRLRPDLLLPEEEDTGE